VAAVANQISTISSTKLKVTTPGSIEKQGNHQRTVEMKNTGLSIISLILSIILISGGLLIKKI
jgi:hypothetical protein